MEVVVFTSGIKIKQFIKIFMKTAKEVDKTTNIPRVITYSTHVKCGDNYLKTKQIIVSFMFTKELTSLNEIEEFLQQNNMSFIYIYIKAGKQCLPCCFTQLRELLDHYPLIRLGHIDANVVPEVAAD